MPVSGTVKQEPKAAPWVMVMPTRLPSASAARYVQSFRRGWTRGFVHLLIDLLGKLPQGFDATGGVVLAEQALHRHIDEIGIADVAQAVAPSLFDDFG